MRTVSIRFNATKLLEGVKELPDGGTINECRIVTEPDGDKVLEIHYEHENFPPNGCASDVVLPFDEHLKLSKEWEKSQKKRKKEKEAVARAQAEEKAKQEEADDEAGNTEEAETQDQ